MLLVDRLTGIVAQSYGTDAALLAELGGSWPPADEARNDASPDGYRPTDLAALEPAGAVRLTERFAIALAAEPAGSFASVPLVREASGGPWRRASAGDGISAFVAGVPLASERSLGVDQTHHSVVVGERAIVKWFRRAGPEPSRAAILLAHLAAVGYDRIPAPLGGVSWRSPGGVQLTLAQGDAFLPDARDGWEWCVERAPDDRSIGRSLGELVRGLHEALATPSTALEEPCATADLVALTAWRAAARATLDEALAVEEAGDLAPMTGELRAAIDALPVDRPVPIQPVHGDLHVGQVLEWPGGLAVIDFDGNPTLSADANAIRQPRERDVAQVLSSLDHVGRVVDERSAGRRRSEVEGWIAATRDAFLAAVGPIDERLLGAFEVEQECRELVYAARFLPRWRYAPIATLRARFGGR
jgi:maltokinase